MPTLRIMQDGRPIYARAGAPDASGVPSWSVGGGNAELVALDFTAWLGTATLATSTWNVSGGTTGAETNSGGVATVLVTVPSQAMAPFCAALTYPAAVTLGHYAEASDGRILRQALRLYPQPASVENYIVFDAGVLG